VASARTAEEVKQISDTPAKLATYKEQYIKLEVKNRYIGRKIVVQREQSKRMALNITFHFSLETISERTFLILENRINPNHRQRKEIK
jgi:hypothetical protein